jgi:hypothetical protein
MPKGIAANTMKGLTACLNWMTRARKTHRLLPGRRIDIEVADVGQRRALLGAHPGDDGNLVVAVAQNGEARAVHRGGRGPRHVEIAHAGHVGAIGVEADERHDDHQGDRFVQAVHEQVDVLADLPRLIGGSCQDQVGREQGAQLTELAVHDPACAALAASPVT